MHHEGARVSFTAVQPRPMKVFYHSGIAERVGLEHFCVNIREALAESAALIDPEAVKSHSQA